MLQKKPVMLLNGGNENEPNCFGLQMFGEELLA
jgi:hypothetical protein